MKIAIGPFPDTDHDRWPVFGSDTLAPEFQIIPFGKVGPLPECDACVWWSPEYLGAITRRDAFNVAFLGDWHINIPGDINKYDLIATDYRGTKMLRDRGVPDSKILWWRGFSFDPRIHTPTPTVERDLDWAFMGRSDNGPRDALLDGLAEEWCKRHPDRLFRHDFGPFKRGQEAWVYQRAKTVVGFSQRGEVQMRAYEAMACGALYVCQHDTDEIWQTHAPISTYEPTLLADFLDAWLENDAAREAKVKAQWEWVQRETPARHLRYLCEQIRERMERNGVVVHGTGYGHETKSRNRTLGNNGPVLRDASSRRVQGAEVDPTTDEQRLECVALIPPTAKRIIDLGTNVGGVPWAIKQRTPDAYVVGVDLDERATEIASQRMDEFHVFNLTAEHAEWEKQPWYQEGGYDCVLMLDIVEHVLENARLVESAKRLLAPDGVIVASIPQVRSGPLLYRLAALGRWEYFNHAAPHRAWAGPVDNVLADAHVRFFCQRDIEQLFLSVGMTIKDWSVSLMDARGLEQWTQDLADLIGKHAGAAQRADFLASSNVIQFIFRAERLPA